MSTKQNDIYLEGRVQDFKEAYQKGLLYPCLMILDEMDAFGFEKEVKQLVEEHKEESLLKLLTGL